ncbi:carbon-nitrogen hydrolase [Chaetomidium leptoderma]|uniref:Carbon-nitrogen hydrolase n=1 Tax=Chaetomidium leptoderma TaxID=669021 RepID=A0AAN6VMI1_9PEZI|nr:carbon-nitrogen hydrolase [Chaetomidium leptoderma]
MASTPTKFKVAAAHAAPVFMDKAATIKKVVRLIEQAAAEDVKLLVFPETFVPGYPVSALVAYAAESVVVEPNNADMAPLQDAACRRAGVVVNLGISRSACPTAGHSLFQRAGSPSTSDGRHPRRPPGEHVARAGVWPALSTMCGWESLADAQIETAQEGARADGAGVGGDGVEFMSMRDCLEWMRVHLGEQELVGRGGGWSAVIHPFCGFMAGPHTGEEERLVIGEVDLAELAMVKVWIDAQGHYQRPEILSFGFDDTPYWADEKKKGWFKGQQEGGKGEEKEGEAE